MVSAVSWNMAVDMEGGVVQPRARPTLGTRFSTDLETIRGRFRFVGAGMIITGALWLVTIVGDLRLGQAGRVMFMPILVAARRPTLLSGPGHGPSKRWNRRAGPRNRWHCRWPAGRARADAVLHVVRHRRGNPKRYRSPDAPELAELGRRIRTHLERRTLALVPTVRGLVPTKVGQVGASPQ